MSARASHWGVSAAGAAGLAACLLAPFALRVEAAPQDKPYTTWSDYGGSADSMQYSALAQINKANVAQLQRAWFYPVPGEPSRLAFNPLVVDDVMYVAGPKDDVVALDAATGKERWKSSEEATERGITYWESKDRLDRRLILTTNSGLREISAATGRLITTFGRNGPRRHANGNPAP